MDNKSQISQQTRKKLGSLLVLIGETEMQIEFGRQNLCKTPSFEPYAAFQRIDRNGQGYITARDLLSFVK